MSLFTGKKEHLALGLTNTPTRVWTKYQTMSCQSTLRNTSPNKTGKTGDNATTAAPLVERTRLLGLNALHLCADHGTCDRTWTKQPTKLSTVL